MEIPQAPVLAIFISRNHFYIGLFSAFFALTFFDMCAELSTGFWLVILRLGHGAEYISYIYCPQYMFCTL